MGVNPPARCNKLTQGFARLNRIVPGVHKFALQPDQLGLMSDRHPDIGGRKNGYDVSRLQLQILRGIVLQYELSKIERDELRFEGVLIEPFNDRIVPIDFRSRQAHIRFLGLCNRLGLTG